MRIVLLGAPGSGKGTQSKLLARAFQIPHISTGDLLRDARARGTALGRRVQSMMDVGQLVDDATVLGIIRERLGSGDTANGFILDGYPRNAAQASGLGDLLRAISAPLDAVLLLDITAQILLRRLSGRRICAACGQLLNIYTVVSSEIIDGKHATDGGLLLQRPDDVEEVIHKRLQVYQDQTAPLIAHYGHAGVLRRIKADAEVGVVFESMRSAIESRRAKPVVRLE